MFQRQCWWARMVSDRVKSTSCGSRTALPVEGGDDGFAPVSMLGGHSCCRIYSLKIFPQACAGHEIKRFEGFALHSQCSLFYVILFELNNYSEMMIERYLFSFFTLFQTWLKFISSSLFKALFFNREKNDQIPWHTQRQPTMWLAAIVLGQLKI